MAKPLNNKQERFARKVVLNGGDKVAAFKCAGWKWKGFTKAALGVESDKKYNHPRISLRIAELQATQDKLAEKQFKVDSGFVIRRLKEIDDLDIIDIFKDDLSAFKPLSEWPKAWRISISGIDIKRIVSSDKSNLEAIIEKIKWPDKAKNLEMIGRHVTVKAWENDSGGDSDSDRNELIKSLIDKLPN